MVEVKLLCIWVNLQFALAHQSRFTAEVHLDNGKKEKENERQQQLLLRWVTKPKCYKWNQVLIY